MTLEELALTPMVGTPMSFSGNVSLIRHPVHRAVAVAEGLAGCLELGTLVRDRQDVDDHAAPVKAILDVHQAFDMSQEEKHPDHVLLIDLAQAAQSLDLIQQSRNNATLYAKGWEHSGLDAVSAWLRSCSERHESGMPIAVHRLIGDILQEADLGTQKEDSEDVYAPTSAAATEQLSALAEAASEWTRGGHAELRDRLGIAMLGKDWYKLRWWKLFWRVDDVGMILSQMLERNWLSATERNLLWLEGRLTEARLEQDKGVSSPSQPPTADNEVRLIENERATLLMTSLPRLESLAQKLVLQTSSLTTLSSAFSILVYISWPAITAAQAGAFAALGLSWSLRRMQVKWEEARKAWMDELREEGRKTLRETENHLRERVERGSAPLPRDVQSMQDNATARRAIADAKSALDDLGVMHSRKQG